MLSMIRVTGKLKLGKDKSGCSIIFKSNVILVRPLHRMKLGTSNVLSQAKVLYMIMDYVTFQNIKSLIRDFYTN